WLDLGQASRGLLGSQGREGAVRDQRIERGQVCRQAVTRTDSDAQATERLHVACLSHPSKLHSAGLRPEEHPGDGAEVRGLEEGRLVTRDGYSSLGAVSHSELRYRGRVELADSLPGRGDGL